MSCSGSCPRQKGPAHPSDDRFQTLQKMCVTTSQHLKAGAQQVCPVPLHSRHIAGCGLLEWVTCSRELEEMESSVFTWMSKEAYCPGV